jgi:putative ABC transport system permease protein
VTAVLTNLPTNSTIGSEIFTSGRSAWSSLTFADAHPMPPGAFRGGFDTYARLSPGARAADLQHAVDVAGRPLVVAAPAGGVRLSFHLTRLDDVHWLPEAGATEPGVNPSGDKKITYGIAAVAGLMVLVAGINFVTLMTARAARRGVEVGVRKVTGASRHDLIIQFMSEALIQVAASVVIAAAMAEVLIGPFDALIQRDLSIDFVHDPALLAGLVAFALAVGALAAIYPALVLSSFRPQAVLKGGTVRTAGSPLARAAMVAIQFAVLVALIFTTTTIYRQTWFALAQGIGASDSKLIAEVSMRPCKAPFREEVRKLPGVSAVACSTSYMLLHGLGTPVDAGRGRHVNFDVAPTDFGFLELNGVRPLAGRLFSRAHAQDGVLANPDAKVQPPVVINETAARVLGYANPEGAIGQALAWTRSIEPGVAPVPGKSEIIGVVPDMPDSIRTAVHPTLMFVGPKYFDLVSIKLTGKDIPGTMRAIQAIWKRTGDGPSFDGYFLSQYRLNTYAELLVQGEAMAICAGLTVLLAGLGLFALSAFMTERRTKEIGIRKALGAGKWDVMALLLWQFTLPVLCAVAVAAPVGFLAMRDWLGQFVYRVPLSLWTFALAALAAVVIAWLTVAWQSYVAARARPAGALQYE